MSYQVQLTHNDEVCTAVALRGGYYSGLAVHCCVVWESFKLVNQNVVRSYRDLLFCLPVTYREFY